MTIGQVTISAADWIASRVTDRMALVVAGQRSPLAQQTGGKAVAPSEENTGAQLDRRERERAMLAAQESYKRVAQRIKSRLANPLPPADQPARPGSAAEQKAQPPDTAQARLDTIFGLTEAERKKVEDRQAASVDEKENEAAIEAETRAANAREQALETSGTAPVFEKGLWDDLFIARDLTRTA